MPLRFFSSFYLPLLFLTALLAIYRWQILSKADKWICVLLVVTLIQECISTYIGLIKLDNFFAYHVYTFIELFLIALYFDRSIGFRKPYFYGIIIGVTGIILSLVNTFYFQSTQKFNSYFLLFEQCVIISLCLLSFYRLLLREDVVPSKMTHFWVAICFLFYSSLTLANNGLYAAVIGYDTQLSRILNWTREIANLLFYLGIAVVFVRYKKLVPSGE